MEFHGGEKMSKSKREWKQGFFSPNHPEKYQGTHPIVYRSGLELAVMRFFDDNSNIIRWGSESVIIPYQCQTDGKMHKYFTDFVVEVATKNGDTHKYIIEVKPYKQTIPPTTSGKKKQKTIITEQFNWVKNCSKWDSAKKWCQKNNYKFSILTEKDIEKYIK